MSKQDRVSLYRGLTRRAVAFSGLAAGLLLGASAYAADTIKIAFNDPLSGGNGNVGEQALKQLQFMVNRVNEAGGVKGAKGAKYEVVTFDNKSDPQEALVQAQKAIDQGIRIITQGISASAVGAALTDFIAKYNDRNPGKEVIYLNFAANDPSLTNEKCQFWHFRFSAHTDMKTMALVSYMASRPEIKKVYLVNPDYSAGRNTEAMVIKQLKEKRPDIQIVGTDLPPLFKVTDFSPYIAKIRAAGADSVVSGNFAQDMSLLLKAAADANLNANWFTFYANNPGGPTAMKQAGLNRRVYNVVDTFANNPPAIKLQETFRNQYGFSMMVPGVLLAVEYLTAAINETNSLDPKVLASHLEGKRMVTFNGSEGFIRKDDHQFFGDQYVTTLGPVSAESPLEEEKTGWGWLPVQTVKGSEVMLPTTCKMDRP